MREFFSPLRYPGGKAKVSGFVQALIRENALLDGIYVEPYVGGGAVALSLLINEYVREVYINDKDLSIYAFWHSVLYQTEAFCGLIEKTPVNIETWEELRKYQAKKEETDLLLLGFSTFFLNRTNRSGILKAGVIGGRKQKSNYKIDARFNKEDLIKRIRRISDYAKRIHLSNEDAVLFIEKLTVNLPQKVLFYLDPPYCEKGKGLYMNYYDEKDHKKIANVLAGMGNRKWILSYDNDKFIKGLYSNYRQQQFKLNYSASKSSKGVEIMIFSDNLLIPSHSLFSESKE